MFVQYAELFGGLHYTLCLLDSSLWPNATVLVITVCVRLRDTLTHCTGWFLSWYLIIHMRNHCIIFVVFITLPFVMCFLVVERVSEDALHCRHNCVWLYFKTTDDDRLLLTSSSPSAVSDIWFLTRCFKLQTTSSKLKPAWQGPLWLVHAEAVILGALHLLLFCVLLANMHFQYQLITLI